MQPATTPNPAPQSSAPVPTQPMTISPVGGINKTWSKAILLNNYITLGVCAGFLLLVDVPILIQSPDLAFFFYLMLASTFLVIGFTIVDYRLSRSLRYRPVTSTDRTILTMGILRNIIAILNVIPFIQLFAILLTFSLVGPAVVITEIILTIVRARQPQQTQVQPQQPIVQ